jgi:Peptidase family S41
MPSDDQEYGRALPRLASFPTLEQFLERWEMQTVSPDLTVEWQIVEQALVLFESYYCHLDLKRALHGTDPVRRLNILRQRILRRQRARQREDQLRRRRRGELPPEEVAPADPKERFLFDLWWMMDFHREMADIFVSVRDRHMNYYWPPPFADHWAYLGCEIEETYLPLLLGDDGRPDPRFGFRRQHLITHVHPDLRDEEAGFVEGAVVHFWNGTPIDRAVELSAARNPGSNPEASRAVGVARLTIVPMNRTSPPDGYHVELHYAPPLRLGRDRKALTNKRWTRAELAGKRLEWRVLPNELTPARAQGKKVELGIDREGEAVRRLRCFLAGSDGGTGEADLFSAGELLPAAATSPPEGPPPFGFAYLRLFSFNAGDTRKTLDEIRRAVHRLPQSGLVVDLRDNPGGSIQLAETLLQELAPRPVEPQRFQFAANPMIEALTRLTTPSSARLRDWQRWGNGLTDRLEAGESHSQALPITTAALEREPRIFYGPVVLVTNARTYSAADMFAAGFQDNRIGTVLGTHSSTGAGGANVLQHQELVDLLDEADPGGGQQLARRFQLVSLRDVGGGAGMSVALRRSLRIGERAGTPLEDLGVQPDAFTFLSTDDALHGNVDLKRRAAELLDAEKHLMAAAWGADADREWVVRVRAKAIPDFRLDLIEGPLGVTARLPFEDAVLERTVELVVERRQGEAGIDDVTLTTRNLPRRRTFTGVLVRGVDRRGETLAGWVLQRQGSAAPAVIPAAAP